MIPNGRFPLPVEDPSSRHVLLAAVVEGRLMGRLRTPNRVWGDLFTATAETGELRLDPDDTFGLIWPDDGQRRIVGVFHIEGENQPSEWVSTDDGHTWRRVSG